MALRFVLDPGRCTGCGACVLACNLARDPASPAALDGPAWRRLHTYNPFRHPDQPVFHLSLACHHCEAPACLAACPAAAYERDAATGAVRHHPERCLGCQYCTWACPHDAPRFNPRTRIVEKCTLCEARLATGQVPACAASCPVGALAVEPRTGDPANPRLPGIPEAELRPATRIVAPRSEGPRMARLADPGLLARELDRVLRPPRARITLKGEWSLLAFTTVLALLVAWQAAALLGGPALRPRLFLGAGLGVMLLSAAHLGRPLRAWRAIWNLRRSWLSREIALASAFLGLAALALAGGPGGPFRGILGGTAPALAWAAAAAGLLALLAVDRLYRVTLTHTVAGLHSAHALLNALYLTGLLADLGFLALGVGGLKVALYVFRKAAFHRGGRPPRMGLSLLRLLLGFAAPAMLAGCAPALAALGAALGDLVDRSEYYDEMDADSPARDLLRALRVRLSAAPTPPRGSPPP